MEKVIQSRIDKYSEEIKEIRVKFKRTHNNYTKESLRYRKDILEYRIDELEWVLKIMASER